MPTKTYQRAAFHGSGQSRAVAGQSWSPFTITINSQGSVVYNDHPGWYKNDDGDSGGPFLLSKSDWSVSPGFINSSTYQGPWVSTSVNKFNTGAGPVMPTWASDSAMITSGATMMSRCLPTNPSFSLPIAMGDDLEDGLPRYIGSSLLKEKVRVARSAGDEYLNYEFGWLPLVGDVQQFARAVKNRNKILRSYQQNANRKIRRRYIMPGSGFTQGSGTGIGAGTRTVNASVNCTWSMISQTRFAGAFRYSLPMSDSFMDSLERSERDANKLLGVSLTPDLLWQLAPWSWAVDWFTNTGSVVNNITQLGFDGLVMQYGYATQEQVLTVNYNASLLGTQAASINTVKLIKRIGASPFGFGLTSASLSDRQKAIIAALGLSRSF